MYIIFMERALDLIKLTHEQLQQFCLQYFDQGHLSSFEILTNGAANTSYKILWDNKPYILRFYVRNPSYSKIDATIHTFIKDSVPVPELLYADITAQPYPFAIFEFVHGIHLHDIKDKTLAPKISYELGKNLALMHKNRFPQAGFFGQNLSVDIIFEEGSSPYYEHIIEIFTNKSLAWQRIGDDKAKQLMTFIQENKSAFPTVVDGGCLVHSDYKPVNLLWFDEKVTVLDWEFTHSGHPLIDFAVIQRHFDKFPSDIKNLEKGYREFGGVLKHDWLKRAQVTDLINLLQLLNSKEERPQLFESLLKRINLTMDNGKL